MFAEKSKFAFSVKHIPKAHWLQVTSCHTDLFTFTFHLMTLHHFITYLFLFNAGNFVTLFSLITFENQGLLRLKAKEDMFMVICVCVWERGET